MYDEHSPDLCGTIYQLPFASQSFDRAYLGHVMEHLVWERIPEAVLELRRVLKRGAQVVVVGPCIEKAIRLEEPYWLLETIRAKPDSDTPGIHHAWTPTTLLTRIALERSGLVEIKEVSLGATLRPAWPNQIAAEWQCAFLAKAP